MTLGWRKLNFLTLGIFQVLEQFRNYLGLQAARFVFRGMKDEARPMTNFFSGAKNVLIVLPVGYDDAIVASDALRKFRDTMKDVHLTVVHNSTRFTSLVDFPKCEVIRLDPPDVNRFYLPTQGFLARLPKRGFDVALDLNVDFVLYSAYIFKASQAPVRVGFVHDQADVFYNVLLNFSGPRTAQALFAKFADCLEMF
jgi:ADP-heptose:LPS heptosyltransferase